MSQMTSAAGPRTRHGCLIALAVLGGLGVILVIVVVVALVASGGSGSKSPAAAPAVSGPGTPGTGTTAPAVASGPGIGSQVRDGKFSFVVTRVSHLHSVGDVSQGLGATAQGEFTVLHVKVTNIGNQAQPLDDSAQFVLDSRGRKFSADSAADIYANQGNGGGVFLNNINPGNTVRGVILFDLPIGDHAAQAQLHDSLFSGGVTVNLTH